jgi:putative peptide zinc metalloprotease protein
MTSTLDPAGSVTTEPAAAAPADAPLAVAAGAELLGELHGSGYADDTSLVRRGDGQMVQLGPLLYGVLEAADGHRSNGEIAAQVSRKLGRRLDVKHVQRIAEKLAAQGLLAGSEAAAPPRRNPLLALRWKVLVTNPRVTGWLTAPFTVLFRPWVMWPVVGAFLGVCWFVLFEKGLAAPGAEAFRRPGLLLLIFAIGVVSAGFHELGHAAACRYGGATPGGMGVGVYLVWPAFYTDVTDAYRLDRRSRLRVDLAGLYFNALIAVALAGVWAWTKVDAVLLGVAIQLILMVKQLSPVIRADGYHILADATGVPDLFAHIGPTLRRLIPGTKRSPSALTGKARALVTIWVLVVVPVLLSLMAAAILLLPRLAASAWQSGHRIVDGFPEAAGHGDALAIGAGLLQLFALALPVLGSGLIAQRLVRASVGKARAWSAGRPRRRAAAVVAGLAVVTGIAWAWWPNGQYEPVRSTDRGTLASMLSMLGSPASVARPAASPVLLPPGRYLAAAMIPKEGVTSARPAFLLVRGASGDPVAVLSTEDPATAPERDTSAAGSSTPTSAPTASDPVGSGVPAPTSPVTAVPVPVPAQSTPAANAAPTVVPPTSTSTAFPFELPAPPAPGDTQALATNQTDGGVVYRVAYAVVTVSGDDPVVNDNSAFAIASCNACTTVAVSFQVVLVVGESHAIAPIDAAGALNYNCPACMTTAIATQLVVTLTDEPPTSLRAHLEAALSRLDLLPLLGASATPDELAAEVEGVQEEVEDLLRESGLLAEPLPSDSPTATATTSPSVPVQSASPDPTASSPTDSQSPTESATSTPSPSETPTPSPSATEPTAATPTQSPTASTS